MKKYIIAAAAALMAMGAQAVESVAHTLVITKKSGETVEYKFADRPVATFAGEDMTITLALTGQSFAYPMAQVATLTVTPQTLGVDDAALASTAVTFEYDGTTLTCRGLSAGATVALYNLGGTALASTAAASDGTATIDLSNLAKGVYVISAGAESFKFIK